MEIYRPEENDVDGRIILKRTSSTEAGMTWNEFIWIGTGKRGRFYEGGKKQQGP